jgi:hypothetical protein
MKDVRYRYEAEYFKPCDILVELKDGRTHLAV